MYIKTPLIVLYFDVNGMCVNVPLIVLYFDAKTNQWKLKGIIFLS